MNPTKEQETTRNSHHNDGLFKCPECGEEWIGLPLIENPGEEETQIHCLYGCGYIFLNDISK